MNTDRRPVSPITQKHRDAWKNSWDFLGGTRSWDEALKRHNAAKKAERKLKLVEAPVEEQPVELTP